VNPLSPQELEQCIELLQRLSETYRTMEPNVRLRGLVRKLYLEGGRGDREHRRHVRHQQRQEDRALLASTTLVQHQRDSDEPLALPKPGGRYLHEPESCYVCKSLYTEVHHFYHFLCPQCAAFNYAMRGMTADLTGRVALITGGRIKIGHQLVLRMLRDGATVLVVTRFPCAAARRFEAEDDASEWLSRLRIYGLDLRDIPAVEAFADRLLAENLPLDILVHNAAQTIQRPPGFYQNLLCQERSPEQTLSPAARSLVLQPVPATVGLDATTLLQGNLAGVTGPVSPTPDLLPLDSLHDREERVDTRDTNSWLLPLEEVSAREMLEVQLVNSVAPALLNARLKPALVRSPFSRRFIVNVSAMEGQFARHKTIYHPHTNMAKAALNMMTHTSAPGYARDGIYMNSVDTGWVTDENPTARRLRKQQELGFFAPLDIVDGMARIYHPIVAGIQNEETPFFGKFLKDYAPCKW
jgi:NAD(P)-dependent dehydrogenase (short-subunit alcohol dehydrogenase family)